jgi:hypothetical protein
MPPESLEPLEFEPPVAPELRQRIIELVAAILDRAPKVKTLYGRDLAMDEEDAVVGRSAKLDLGEEVGTVSVAESEPSARPPFEWIVEVTSEINSVDYLKHYLVRDDDMMLAHRKVLTEVGDREAKLLIIDLEQALASLQ